MSMDDESADGMLERWRKIQENFEKTHGNSDRMDALSYLLEQKMSEMLGDRIRFRPLPSPLPFPNFPIDPRYPPFTSFARVEDDPRQHLGLSRNERIDARVTRDLDEVFLSMCGIKP